jgi:acyl-CoA reductase-like NAD-dependent aldehyde dehydrogenase
VGSLDLRTSYSPPGMEARTETERPAGSVTSGAEAEGDGGAGSDTIEVHRPADGSLIASVPIDSPERVREVVSRVRSAQPAWEAIGIGERYRWLGGMRDWLIDNGERIADVMQEETGKVRADAALEVPYLCDVINFYGTQGRRLLADERPSPHLPLLRTKRLRVVYRPYPVVGIISPWNFPLMLSFGDAIPALAAGAAVVIKPSEFTPLSLLELLRGWRDEVRAPDVFDVVTGTGETGGALVDEADFIGFTGSDRTGREVMRRAADTLTPVSLELGGKDPAIVLRDADIDRAVNATAFGGLVNGGQVCTSIERVYVEEPIYDEFVERLTAKVRTLRQGVDGRDYGAEVGAMTTPAQAEIVSDHVEDARARGARVLTGGRRGDGPGDWYEPTVIADADHSMKLMNDETFGPVLPVMKVRDAEEAVRLANSTRYGLSGSVFAGDTERGEEVAKRLEAGSCNVNDVLISYSCLNLPMGGWKDSGIGFRHGSVGIRKYMRSESITSPRLPTPKSELVWFPYEPRRRRVIVRLQRLLNARGLRKRLGIGHRG